MEKTLHNPMEFGGVSHAVLSNAYILHMASVTLGTLYVRLCKVLWASLVGIQAMGRIYGCSMGSGIV